MYLLIISLPFFSFILCVLFGRFIGESGAKVSSCILLFISFFISILFFNDIIVGEQNIHLTVIDWFTLGIIKVNFNLCYDSIVCSMLVLILGVSSLVHLFSTSYMEGDPHLPRFMGYLSLFTFFMIILVTSSNLVQLFIGWEGVGLCSYLLINFWFTRIQANKSAIKAMIVNKFGDIGVLLSMALIWNYFGSFHYSSLFSYSIICQENTLNIISTLLLLGVIGKSAQIGLHMWLPDAMEGPTPVSALIHAATMVTAGVFLIIRLSPIFENTPIILLLIVLIGSFTAFFSSTVGLTQNDFKKVIAYSTCSQLGYMVMICGFSQYNLGLFHLINHGFFKALLFLSAGSIIHSLFDEQDLRKSGSMLGITPLTYSCILIGSLSLMGLPFLTGFYSKDLIIEMSYGNQALSFALLLGILSASLTAFYSLRLIHLGFLSEPQTQSKSLRKSHEGHWNLLLPLIILVFLSVLGGYVMQYYILEDVFPIILPNSIKFSALIVTTIGVFSAIIIGVYYYKSWLTLRFSIFHKLYSFSNSAWYFDRVITHYISNPILKLGFNISYKFIDNQLLEGIGPTWFSNFMITKGERLSRFHRGFIYSYIFLFLIFISCFIIQI